jgi:glucokinase
MSDADYALALDVGGTKIAGAIVHLNTGWQLVQCERPTLPARGGRPVLDDAVALAGELHASATQQGLALAGIGIAVCELVDLGGQVTSGHAVAWEGMPLAEAFAHFGPVLVESDVRAHAWAEAAWGAGRGRRQFVFVTIGTGISSCLVLDGQPYAGARGNALIMASNPVTTLCPACGNAHWVPLEDFASGPALVLRYNARTQAGVRRAEEVLALAEAGEVDASWVVLTAGRELGASLAWLVNVLDPQVLILGGGLGSASGLYWDSAVESTREHIWSRASRELPIVKAALGPEAALAGAARALAVAQGSPLNQPDTSTLYRGSPS